MPFWKEVDLKSPQPPKGGFGSLPPFRGDGGQKIEKCKIGIIFSPYFISISDKHILVIKFLKYK